MKNKFKMTLLAALIASTGVITACGKAEDPAAAQQQMPKTVVDVQTIELQSIPVIQTFSGRVAAIETADVRPQATGVIDEVLFREGSIVQAGQPLYRINVDSYVSNVESGKAAVNNAMAGVQNAQSGVKNAEAVRQSAIANLNAQEAALAQARADLARLDGLLQAEAISRQAYDQAVTAVRTAEANVSAARATVNQADASIASARASLQSAQSSVGSAQASLNASQLDISRTIVRAPISGQTSISNVTAGALVAANQANALVTITRTDQVYVDISQSSAEMLRLREQLMSGRASQGSTEVQLVLEDGSVYPQIGRLALQDARVNEKTGATTLRAVFPNQEGVLIPGMYTNARLIQSVVHNAALLPQSAIIRTPKGETQVYVVNGEGKIEVRNVTTSGTYDGQWIVTDGLTNGDRVVIIGGAKVKPEQEVDVRELPPTTSQANGAAQANPAQGAIAPNAAPAEAEPNAAPAQAASATPMARPPEQNAQDNATASSQK